MIKKSALETQVVHIQTQKMVRLPVFPILLLWARFSPSLSSCKEFCFLFIISVFSDTITFDYLSIG